MADNLIFPIGFDLEKAVEQAGNDWDKTYAKKLEAYLAKRPVRVKLDFEKLEDVKTRLAQLKIEPITPETKAAIKELAKELQTLAKALEQVQKYSKNPTKGAVDASRVTLNEERAKAQAALAAQRAAKAEDNLAAARLKAARSANVGTSATISANSAYAEQSTYLSRLIQRMAAYYSLRQIGNFIASVREVTAQFELQRVSLGAIIQDQQKANQLFSEIKSFALKSPVSILDLTKYTKQLAAYKIGVDELFETTKKLTDVSVGLGVSMDRVVLAYGQTRATGYLRASEIRQFTEMGVPIVEELAAKLSKMNGELVTAADVMDMVSKRGISFELVKEVFDDMTSAGGIFYNMQEKQGNTLFGLWAKLGDAASVMYSEIGNTGIVGQGMRTLIQWATDAMKHWSSWGKLIIWAGSLYLANAAAMKVLQLATLRYTVAGKKNIIVSRAKALATVQEIKATKNAGLMAQWGARMDLAAALAKYKAATATNVLSASLYRLKAAFLSNPFGWIIAVVGTLIALFADFSSDLDDLQANLGEINEKYKLKELNDGDNFKRLADGAVKAANGSKEQRENLEELDRTYGKIVGSENLQIEKLRAMNGEYGSLIETIKEYNIQMKYSEREGAIKEYYGGKKKEAFGTLEEEISTVGVGKMEAGHEAGAAIATSIQDALLDELEKNGSATVSNANKILSEKFKNLYISRGKDSDVAEEWTHEQVWRLSDEIEDYVEALNSERAALDENNKKRDEAGGKLAKLRKEIEATKKDLENKRYFSHDGKALDEDSFLYQQMVANETMKKAADLIRNSQEMKDALGDKAKELEPEWLHLVDRVDQNDLMNITTVNFDAILKIIGDKYPDLKRRIKAIQEEWGNVAPTNATALQIRQKLYELSMSFDPTLQKMKQFLWDGSGTVDEYLKRLKVQQEELNQQLKEKQETLLNWTIVDWLKDGKTKEQIEAEINEIKNKINVVKKLVPYVTNYTVQKDNKKRSGGSKSDPRLQNLKEEISLYEKLYQEYKQYEKAVGSSKAAEYMEREAKDTIDALAKKYGIGLPKNVKDLTAALEILYKKMKALPSKVFKNLDKELKESRWKIEKVDIDESQKNIEAELKRLSDRISRTKTAKEFYEKILGMTGNVDMAINLTTSIFGENGNDLNKQIALQINELMQSGEGGIEIGLDVVGDGHNINYKNLRKLTEEAYKAKKIGDQAYKDLIAIADNGEKDVSKMVDGWLKATEKAKSYSDKLLDLARTTNAEIAKIEAQRTAGNITEDYAKAQIQGYKDKQAQEIAKLQYEAFKDSPMYVQMFDDLDNASTTMLRNMKQRIEELKTSWKDLTPTQLKEMQSRLNEIDTQLAKRNPFKGLIDGIKEYRNLRKGGDTLGNKSEGAAEKALDAAAKARLEAEKEYLEILNKEGATQEEIADAKKRFDDAAADEDAAAKALENWKKVKDAIGLSANELFQMLNWAGDIAKGIADISEAMGADEEDVQYWNDVADALGQISGGIQDIVSAAMSGNVTGIISSTLTAIPKMFVGFTNLFSAGKIKRANKEIKRQQELLEQLEYTYSRLEAKADKLFGRDYINNFKKQQENLEAQARAYKAQADAERSKGKKADEGKIKEYENAYRETMDKIADMQGKLAEQMTGSDIASSARDFANAWLEAYASFGNTAGAIKDKFKDMIKNMVVESVLAQTVQRSLQPMFDKIDEMYKQGASMTSVLAYAFEESSRRAEEINNALTIAAHRAEQAGVKLRLLNGSSSEFSGISRDIASASEESINGLAAGVNTQNYYMSYTPRIYDEVAALRAMLEKSYLGSTMSYSGGIDYTDIINISNQHLSSLPSIEANTAQTVKELQEVIGILRRVTIPKGGSTAYGVNVYMRN